MLETVWIEILNMSLTASVVILAVCLIRLFFKRMPKIFSYALWAVVLFRLLCPFSLESSFSFLNVMDGSAAAEQGRMEYISSDIGYQAYSQTEDPGNTTNETVSVTLPAEDLSDTANGAESGSLPEADAGDSASLMQIVLSVTAWIWLAGVLGMAIYQLVSLLRFRRRLRGAEHEEGNIYRLPGKGTPFVYGLIRPRIYLPVGLSGEERRYMLLHEQIHIRRADQIFRFLACLALCLHWFNPLVWLAFYFSGKDMELSCDEAVLRQLGDGVKKEYSGSLLALAAGEGNNAKARGIPIAFGENNVKSRIQSVLRYRRTKPVVAFLAALICVTAVAALALNPRSEEAESAETDTYTIIMADGNAAEAEIPDVVLAAAQTWIAGDMENWRTLQEDHQFRETNGEYDYLDYRISSLELICTYENLNGADYEAWMMNYEYLVDNPDSVVLAGAMEIDSEGWLMAGYPNSRYLIFEKTGDTLVYTVSIMENDTSPEKSGFVSDLRAALQNAGTYQSWTRSEGYVLQNAETSSQSETGIETERETGSDGIPGYILYFADSTVVVDTVEWITLADTERMAELGITGDEMPGGFLIYNPDSDAESLTLSENLTALLLDWENSYYPMDREVSLEELFEILQTRAQRMGSTADDGSASADYSQCGLFWFEVTDGVVTYMEEQYVP